MSKLELKPNTIIIVKNNQKKDLIKNLSQTTLSNVKIISLEEFRKKYYFDYDNKTIYYLMKKYNYQLDVAKMYLSHLYEVGDENFNSSKIQKIISLKEELLKNNLLITNNYFSHYLKDKNIIVYNYQNLTKIDKKMLEELTKIATITYYEETKQEYSQQQLFEFNTIEEEVTFVASKICELLKKGISLNNIKLCGITGEYPELIKRLFTWYHLPITFNDSTLYKTPIAKSFLNNLNDDINVTLEHLQTKYNLTNSNNLNIYNALIKIINNYTWLDNITEAKPFIIDEMQRTTINNLHYETELEILNTLENTKEENYYFLLGFNQGIIPQIYKDEDYFNDELKLKLNLDTTNELNKKSSIEWFRNIKATKNLIITTKKNSPLGPCYISSLNDDLGLEIISPKLEYTYSALHNQLKLAEKLDTLIKYNEKEPDLELLYSNYSNLEYRSFNANYQKINQDKLKQYLNNKLTLSYSAINTYFQCGFRYYLSNILKLNIYEETFYTFLGNLFHYILSLAVTREINIQEEYYNYISKATYPFNEREKFFLDNLEKELEYIISVIHKQNEFSSLTKTYVEEKIETDKSRADIEIKFKGFVDKLLVNEEENIVSIIDYKTGNPNLNLNNIIYGLDLQLPVYIYLARKKFKDAKIAGFYLQKILNTTIIKDYKHTFEFLKEDKLKLQGYSNSNESILETFDSSYNESKVIKGMRTTTKGIASKKVLNDEAIDQLEALTEEKINEAINGILNADFNINPKRVGLNNLGCEYCTYKDICFMTEKNIETKKEYKNMEFLGGEDNDTN